MSLSHTAPRRAPARAAAGPSDLYRAVWRWHFYAGLLVLPFLILLAVTGGVYLFRAQLDPLIHADLMRVEARATPSRPPSEQVAAALAASPGTAFRYIPPAAPDAAAEVGIKAPDGARTVVYVDPHEARVLGSLSDKGTAMGFVRRLHSLAVAGPLANALIEVAAGWTILLVLTGFYLWWPRRAGTGGVVTLRGRPRERVFWRDLHAVTAAAIGGVLLFLAITGMPWSSVWGRYANEWANGHNFGYPAGLRVALPMSDEHLAHAGPTSWSLEQARLPLSAGEGQPIGLDAAVARFDALGLAPGYVVALPGGPQGVFTGSVYPAELERQRVIHLDQYSGQPLLDMSYADYGPLGRLLEWGINIHLGQQWGLANQLVLLAVCLVTVAFCVAAAVMWWKRRPAGRLGVPPLPHEAGVLRGVVALLALGGVLFPLVGLSLLVMLGADLLLTRRRRPRAARA
ncbi:PepSY-associated TM helix domain-containing protein [Pseudoroseomonas sp. WGS1072]|uniref:PepSY-associated TM helix domain-containing protein n=1 Tax=Roseomonas sp. WGS1072 TaxID=3366816 RepID=UPI003BF15BBE